MPREGHTVVVWVVTHGGTEQVPAGALCPQPCWFQPKGAPSCASPSDPCTEVTPPDLAGRLSPFVSSGPARSHPGVRGTHSWSRGFGEPVWQEEGWQGISWPRGDIIPQTGASDGAMPAGTSTVHHRILLHPKVLRPRGCPCCWGGGGMRSGPVQWCVAPRCRVAAWRCWGVREAEGWGLRPHKWWRRSSGMEISVPLG